MQMKITHRRRGFLSCADASREVKRGTKKFFIVSTLSSIVFLYCCKNLSYSYLFNEVLDTKINLNSPVSFRSGNLTRAVVHMGVHKTGTSTIQRYSRLLNNYLRLDGYENVWDGMQNFNKGYDNETTRGNFHWMVENAHFAHCFLSKSFQKKIPCDPDALLYGLQMARENRSLFVSLEDFSFINQENTRMLEAYLSNWDEVTIIVYYRRYYSWIVSSFHEMNRYKAISSRKQLLDYIHDCNIVMPEIYTFSLIERLKQGGLKKNLKVINFHDRSHGSLEETFYCYAMPYARHACDAIRSGEAKLPPQNLGPSFDYDDLAFGAIKAGLIQFNDTNTSETKYVIEAIQNHQETTLNLTTHDFPRLCPPKKTLNKIWNASLITEISLFPSLFENYTVGESNLREDFDLAAGTSLCVVDVGLILIQETWKSFFKSLQHNIHE